MIPTANRAPPTNTGHGGRTVAWTDERVDELKALHASGWSAGMIAAAMEGVSRNAVIGKLNRLGLQGGQTKDATPRERKRRAPTVSLQRHAPQSPQPKPRQRMRDLDATLATAPQLPADQSEHAVPFIERHPQQCAWPLWDDATPQAAHMVCGAATLFEQCSYCARHAQIAWVRSS